MTYQIFKPDISHLELIRDYRASFVASNETADGTLHLFECDDIEAWLAELPLFENEAYLLDGWCNTYQYAYGNDEIIVGMINYRADIERSPYLRIYGGHIGYAVRKEDRGKGIGKMMLTDFLLFLKEKYNLKEVLITCLKANLPSKKLIESVGGIYLDEIYFNPENDYVQRYKIELSRIKK